jgi:hypothetical protein
MTKPRKRLSIFRVPFALNMRRPHSAFSFGGCGFFIAFSFSYYTIFYLVLHWLIGLPPEHRHWAERVDSTATICCTWALNNILDALYCLKIFTRQKTLSFFRWPTWPPLRAARMGKDHSKAARFTPSSRVCQVNYLGLCQKKSPCPVRDRGNRVCRISVCLSHCDKSRQTD